MGAQVDLVRQKLSEVVASTLALSHPDVAVNFENLPLKRDTRDGWVLVNCIPGVEMKADIGSTRGFYRQFGILKVDIGVGNDEGTQTYHQIADTLTDAFREKCWSVGSGTLFTRNIKRGTRGQIGGNYFHSLTVEWQFDQGA